MGPPPNQSILDRLTKDARRARYWIAGLGLLMIFGPYLVPKIDLASQETDYPAVSSKVLVARIEEFRESGVGYSVGSHYYELALYLDRYGRFFLRRPDKDKLEPYLEKVELGGVLTVHYLPEIKDDRGHPVVSIRTLSDDVFTFEETMAERKRIVALRKVNVPILQVGGAITFMVGLVLIWRKRRSLDPDFS